jgi:acyl transferase domain-containing protein/aryl carrier-like protein
VASLIKVALALKNREIPASLHFNDPNPNVPFEDLHLRVQTVFGPWPEWNDLPALAGVSAFGFGGTNAHAVLEQAPQPRSDQRRGGADRPLHLLALSARSRPALEELARRYARRLASAPAESLGDLCFSANAGRSAFEHRLTAFAATPEEMAEQLDIGIAEDQPAPPWISQGERPRIAFLFTGQGSQYAGMARRLFDAQPTFRSLLIRCQEGLASHLERPLLSVLFPEPGQEDLLSNTAYTQPALFALEVALAELWRSWGIVPQALLGHSVGEYAAACAAGALSLEEGLELIARRAQLMADLPRNGAMVAIFAGEAEVAEAIEPVAGEVSIAAINGPHNTVISGRLQSVEEVASRFRERGVKVESLQVSHAFHSPLMDPILDRLEQYAGGIGYTAPKWPLIANLTGQPFAPGEMSGAYWRRHARQPVRFKAGMEALRLAGCEVFVEIGPGTTLLGMGAKAWEGPQVLWLPSLRKGHDDWEQILSTLGALFTCGCEVDWRGFDGDYARSRKRIPTYPFQRQRYWFDSALPALETEDRPADIGPLLGRRIDSPVVEGTLHEATFTARQPSMLADHQVFGTTVVPGACYIAMALEAIQAPADKSVELSDVVFGQALVLPEGGRRTVQFAVIRNGSHGERFAVYSRDPDCDQPGSWTLHTNGDLKVVPNRPSGDGGTLEEIRSRAGEQLDGAAFYRATAAREIELGPAFRWLERIWRGDGEALGQLRPVGAAEAGSLLPPGLLDAAFQTLGAALPAAVAEATFLPFAIERFRFHGGAEQPAWCHGRLRPAAGGGIVFTGDLRLLDGTGKVVAEVAGVQIKRAEPWALRPRLAESAAECLYELSWPPAPLSAPGSAVGNGSPGAWLLAVGSPGVETGLSSLLEARGESCLKVLVSASTSDLPDGWGRLDPEDPGSLSSFLAAELAPKGVSCRGAIHLVGLDAELAEDATAEELLAQQKLVCGSALQLVQALARLDLSSWQRLALVTRGAQAIAPSRAEASGAVQASLWGLGAEIATEHPELGCLLVDLDPLASAEENARQLLAEIAARGENRVAWRRGERFARRLVSAPSIGRDAEAARTPIRPDATYLITGGLGALGLELARLLVRRGARHLVLVARRPAEGETIQAVTELRQEGAETAVIAADVSQREAVASLLDQIGQHMPPLQGIFHAAGVVDDGLLLQQSWSRFAEVLRAKVMGAWNLHALSRSQPLEHFVLFSSVASLLPIPGIGSHAADSAFLDAFAHFRRGEGLPAMSVDWGPWAALGRAAQSEGNAAVRHLREEEGIELLHPQQGIELMERLLGLQDPPQVIAVSMNWARLLRRSPEDLEHSLQASELARRRPSAGSGRVSQDKAGFAALFEIAPPEEQKDLVASYLREQVVKILRLPSSQQLDPQRPLPAFGLDSLMAIELRNRLRTVTGYDLPATLLFEHPTLETLGQFVVALLLQSQAGGEVPPGQQELRLNTPADTGDGAMTS